MSFYIQKLPLDSNSSSEVGIFQAQFDRAQTDGRLSRIRHKRYWTSGIKCLLDKLGFSNS